MRPRGQRETFSTVQGRTSEGLGWCTQRKEFQTHVFFRLANRLTKCTWGLGNRQSKATSKFLVAKWENSDKKFVVGEGVGRYLKFLGSI